MQIIQFVLDGLTSLPFAVIQYYGHECRGTMRAWWVGNITGIALFCLFWHFSIVDAKRQAKEKAKAKAAADAAAAAATGTVLSPEASPTTTTSTKDD
jgi:hypothetical protein